MRHHFVMLPASVRATSFATDMAGDGVQPAALARALCTRTIARTVGRLDEIIQSPKRSQKSFVTRIVGLINSRASQSRSAERQHDRGVVVVQPRQCLKPRTIITLVRDLFAIAAGRFATAAARPGGRNLPRGQSAGLVHHTPHGRSFAIVSENRRDRDEIEYHALMEWVLGILIGTVLGGAIGLLWHFARTARGHAESVAQRSRAEMLDQQLAKQAEEMQHLRQSAAQVDARREEAEKTSATLLEKLEGRQDMEKRLTETFDSLSAKALRSSNQQFFEQAAERFKLLLEQFKGEDEKTKQAIDALLKPVRESLDKHQKSVDEIEKKRLAEKSTLEEQLKQIAQSHEKLGLETGRLVTALRRPHQRGRWGELQLRNTVELAGMTAHCDFDEQVTIWNGEAAQRPDMVIRLPGQGVIPVDSKVAIEAYLDAIECQENDSRAECLRRHAVHLATHIRSLANKKYWAGFEGAPHHSPQLVVLFMPLESALIAALEIEPDLHAEAMQQHVLIATPTLLVALLRAVAYGWQQQALQENAKEISTVGRELYERVGKFVEHFTRIGSALEAATKAYNSAHGSFGARIGPAMRKLKELHVTNDAEIELPPPSEIEVRGDVLLPELHGLPDALQLRED